MGSGSYCYIRVHPLEPANSPTLSTGCKVGKHRIQGISDEFIPSIVDLGALDAVVDIDDGDSIIMAQKLSQSLGMGVGISSGANFLGALKLQNEIGKDSVVLDAGTGCGVMAATLARFVKKVITYERKKDFYGLSKRQ